MFIGHFAAGLGAKRLAPTVGLGTLFAASQLADLIWPTLVLLGVERVEVRPGDTAVTPLEFVSYPWSHSLLALALWAGLFALLYRARRHAGIGSLLVLAGLVLSHWLLDALTHRPDLPLVPGGSARVGLELWSSLPGTVIVEGLLFAAGVALYLRATRAIDRTGSLAFWGLVGFLLVVYAANLLGPPPPSAAAVAWTTQSMWLLVLWGAWIDRHRVSSAAPARSTAPSAAM
jgi:membrane-bound metal-dependent hydrolase YbcI (DUF457 family)